MTQEEKAKAYDEALEKAKKALKTDIHESGMWAIQRIFPQLCESEDKRIRKGLIEYFEGFRMGNAEVKWEGLNVQEVLVWLEKQKEQKHPNGCFTCDEYKKGYEEGRRNGFTAGYNKAMKEVEQKEQKPVVTHGETYHVDTLGTQQVIAGKMPQKPAEWSEEDEGELQNAIDALEFLGKKGVYKSESGYDAALQAASWLKSIPERINLQPKQEWNEEDEKELDCIINILDRLGYEEFCKSSRDQDIEEERFYYKEIQFLKRLKSLSAKDKTIEDVISYLNDGVHFNSPIAEMKYRSNLANQLKSLRPQPKQEWSKEDEKM